jgi:large subunit ribosomal protein L9
LSTQGLCPLKIKQYFLKETFEVEQMELILKKTVESLGEEGEIVKVKSGYARNYLIPKKMAVLANKTNLNLLEQEKATIEARREKQRQEAESLSKKISGTIINIKHRVGEEDKLFGSVTAADISEKLAEMNIQIDKKNVLLAEPIKALGEIIVPIKVGYQMTSEITVQVVPLEAE